MDLDFFFGTNPTPAPTKPAPQPVPQQQPPSYDFFAQPQQVAPQQFAQPQSAYPQGNFAGQPAYGYANQPMSGGYSQPAYFGASQPVAQPAAQAAPKPSNNDFFDIFGAAPAQNSAPAAKPQTVQYSSDDFFDMLGAKPTPTQSQPAAASQPSKPAPAPVSQPQASTFKRGQSKKEAVPKKDLNLDAFSQLAVNRQKTPVAVVQAKQAKPAESASESESESESEDDDGAKGPKNIDDDEQNMGTGQGFSPMEQRGKGEAAKKCVAADCNNTFHGAGRYCVAHQRYESRPAESKDADGRKVKGEWSIERKRTGTKMGFIKNITIWKFYFKGEQHTVELRHSTFSGKRVILVDRRQLLSEKRLIGGDAAHKVFAGSDFETRCEITVVIKSNNDRFQYGIFIEGLPIRDAKLKYAEYI